MNWIKDLRNKTWIDWIKILVALDIASVGIALIIGINFHVLANIFGFITRILFGIMYVFVAVLILKRVFPAALHVDEHDEIEEENIDVDIEKGVKEGRHLARKFVNKVEQVSDVIIDKIDHGLDKTEEFFKKKTDEVKSEVKGLVNKK